MFECHALWSEAIDVANAKRLKHAAGVDISTVYKWGRHPLDDSDPDGTGTRGLFDRMESVVDTLAARGAPARPLLKKMRVWFCMRIDEALQQSQGRPLTRLELRTKCTAALREVADVIDAANGGEIDRERVVTEAIEARDVLDRIIASMEHDVREG